MKKTIRFFLSAVIFLVILSFLLAPLQQLFARKSLEGSITSRNRNSM